MYAEQLKMPCQKKKNFNSSKMLWKWDWNFTTTYMLLVMSNLVDVCIWKDSMVYVIWRNSFE